MKIQKEKNNVLFRSIDKFKRRKKKGKKSLNKKRKKHIWLIPTFIIVIFLLIILVYSFNSFSGNNNYIFRKHKTINGTNINENINKIDIDYNNPIKIFDKYLRKEITWPILNKLKFRPLLSQKDLNAFCYFMNPKNIYFEFGSGGSTNIASFYNMTSYSVESDIKWHKILKSKDIKTNYITIDLKSKYMGRPGEGTTVEDWKKYIQAYKSEYNADIILIDGRFRVACALDIFSKIRYDTIVLIHDYNRIYYHIVENYYIKIYQWDILAAFIKRPNFTLIPEEIYNKYIYISD